MARQVKAPDGSTWTIRRLWFHWPRWRGPTIHGRDVVDHLDIGVIAPVGDDPISNTIGAIIVGIMLTIVAIVLLLVFFSLVAFLAELVFLVVAAFALGGPWYVVARNSASGETLRFRARGWRRSEAVADALEKRLERGQSPSFSVEFANKAKA
jgi:hypothetical protein